MQLQSRIPIQSIHTFIIPLVALSLIGSACTGLSSTSVSKTLDPVVDATALESTQIVASTAAPIPSATIPVELSNLKDTNIKILHPWTGQAGMEFGKLIDEFNRENVWEIHVDKVQGGSISEVARTFSDSLETSDRLDLVATSPEYLAGWNSSGHIIDLTSFITNPEWGIPDKEKASFLSQVWEANKTDEQQIGIPAQLNLQFLVYNQTWAAELGFTDVPFSQQEFSKQVCEAAHANSFDKNKDNDGTGGWIINASSQVLISWINASGSNKDWNSDPQNSVNQTETGEAFSFLRGLKEKGCAWSSRVASPFTYFSGRQALIISATLPDLLELEETMSSAKNADEWIILPYPGEEKSAPVILSGLSYGISKSSPNNELASWLFLRWLMLPRNQVRLAEAAGSIPPTSEGVNLMTSFGDQHAWWKDAQKLVPEALILPASSNWQQIRPVLEDGFWQMLQPTPMPIPTLLEQMDETIKSVH